MIKPQLPQLTFVLDETAGRKDLHVFNTLTDRFKKMGTGQATQARWFLERREAILNAISNGEKLKHVVQSQSDIRVLIHLWSTSTSFLSKCPLSKKHLKHVSRIKKVLSASQLFSLIRIYFYQFDQINDLHFFCKYLRDQLRIICANRRISNDMKVYCAQKNILFDPLLKDFWAAFHSEEKSLKEYFKASHIPWDHKAQFLKSAKKHLYVTPIEKLQLGASSSVFGVVSRSEIKNMPFDNQYSLAQIISMGMMDKAVNKNMPDNWRQLIISLLGDPRMPKSSDLYQKSWAGLPSSYENQMQKWLSQMDMLVFLELLKEVGNQTGNEMIRRMFPSRKSFLESLYKTGMITKTRLFLGNDAVDYIEKQYDSENRPMFAQINHKNKSIIYMQVGKAHLMEGTHNYSVRLMDQLPPGSDITDQNKNKYILTELATGLDQAYASAFKESTHLYVVPHDIHNAWQRKLTDILQHFDVHLISV
ncbi:MAG: hypothetical protein OMM_04092 [Candidatus Magnetoglobus multicellularis str. Araruama]|uniref:Zorya protein ZorC EH domain-containing protein n=1 Tax=Candidatus Magnetoglobus multicellularis str. Araruama TaxID=890399 RepID=A0A1V1P2S9_9BACT|nr:MAG: hypothetical protein OMM_04092 [Candidatus Magnetoglobus multicellularis str. Araruama]